MRATGVRPQAPETEAPTIRNRKRVYTHFGYTIQLYPNYERYWALHDPEGELVCLAVYKRGAEEVVRRLQAANNGTGVGNAT
jgi:hypothetical protein